VRQLPIPESTTEFTPASWVRQAASGGDASGSAMRPPPAGFRPVGSRLGDGVTIGGESRPCQYKDKSADGPEGRPLTSRRITPGLELAGVA